MMTETHATAPANTGLADQQLRTAIYFAVGVATEGGASADKLSIAAMYPPDGTIEPVGTSGYTVGTMQIDLGQRKEVAKELVQAADDWMCQQRPGWTPDPRAESRFIADLQRDGNTIRHQGRPQDADLDPAQKERINQFLASDAGKSWVHQQDMKQLDTLMKKAVKPMQETPLYRSVSADDQIRLAVVVAKAYNQNPSISSTVINHANQRNIHTVDAFMAAVQQDGDINPQVREDSAKALHGADVVVALRQAGHTNPLKPMWMQLEQHPLPDPGKLGQAPAHLMAEYATVRNLFINYGDYDQHKQQDRAKPFITALDQGKSYPDMVLDQRMTLVTDGRNLATLDHGKSEQGYVLADGGWMAVSRSQLHWNKQEDHTFDLQLTRDGQPQTLLHMPAPQRQQQHQQQHGQDIHQRPQYPQNDALPQVPSQHQQSAQAHSPASQHYAPALHRQEPAHPTYPASDPRNPDNPEHAFYQSAHKQLAALHDSQGIKLSPKELDNGTAAVMADARAANMRSITSMVFAIPNGQTDTSRIGIYEGDPRDRAGNAAMVNINQALKTPAEQSLERFAQNTQALDQWQPQAHQQQSQGVSIGR
jgi:hypothetical protein